MVTDRRDRNTLMVKFLRIVDIDSTIDGNIDSNRAVIRRRESSIFGVRPLENLERLDLHEFAKLSYGPGTRDKISLF